MKITPEELDILKRAFRIIERIAENDDDWFRGHKAINALHYLESILDSFEEG